METANVHLCGTDSCQIPRTFGGCSVYNQSYLLLLQVDVVIWCVLQFNNLIL